MQFSARMCAVVGAGGLRRVALAAASATALAAGMGCDASAQTLTAANSPILWEGAGAITVTSGTTAVLQGQYYQGALPNGELGIKSQNGDYSFTTTTADADGGGKISKAINVQSGATLIVGGVQTVGFGQYIAANNIINDSGNLVVEGTGANKFILDGANSVLGNLTLLTGSTVNVGESYGSGTLTLGPSTSVSLGAGSLLNVYQNGALTINGALTGGPAATLDMDKGALVLNGQNTAAAPFTATLTISPGASLMVGDASHASAVFGDAGNPGAPKVDLLIARTSGTPATLQGYGTVDANVTNSGVVQPGGTKGTLGTLTVSSYTQTGSGILQIEVSPTGASQLKVLGHATLGGTLALTIDPGSYGNNIYPILTAGSISGGFSQVTTSGSTAAGLAVTPTGYDVVTELTSASQVFGHLVSADQTNVLAFADSLYDALQTQYPGGEMIPKAHLGGGNDAWIMPLGRGASLHHDGYGYDTTSEGVTGGVEHGFGTQARVGIAFSYASETLSTDGDDTHANSNTYDVAVYGGYHLQNARIDGLAFYNSYDSRVDRDLKTAGSISSAPSGSGYGGSLQISNGYLDNMIVPYARGTYIAVRQGAVDEAGTNLLALDVDRIYRGNVYGEAGLKLHPDFAAFLGPLRPELTVAAVHNFTYNQGEHTTAQFENLSGSSFDFDFRGNQGTSGLVGLSLASDITSNLHVFGKVQGDFSTYGEIGEARLGVRYSF